MNLHFMSVEEVNDLIFCFNSKGGLAKISEEYGINEKAVFLYMSDLHQFNKERITKEEYNKLLNRTYNFEELPEKDRNKFMKMASKFRLIRDFDSTSKSLELSSEFIKKYGA